MDRVKGFKAAAAGAERDATQSADWLDGFDGFAIGAAENAAHKAEMDVIAATIPRTHKPNRRTRAASTPRTLHLDFSYFNKTNSR